MRTCSTMKVCVLPAENIEEVVCSVSTEPETLRPGEIFKFVLTCNCHPDESKPELEHPGIRQLSFSTRYSKRTGKRSMRLCTEWKWYGPEAISSESGS